MNRADSFDAIVLGTGQGGQPLAIALAKAGWRVAVIERDAVGGSCVNVGCTPTKTMVASARTAYLARRAADFGVSTGPVEVDLAAVRRRKERVVTSFRSGIERGLERTEGVELVRGHGRFAGPKEVAVDLVAGGERRLRSEHLFVNTGTRAAVPPLAGLSSVPFLDNTTIMELEAVPEHLLIIGGGYIGLELGQMFRRFGSEVTIVQRAPQLLPREDRDVADAIRQILHEDGVEVLLQAEAQRVEGGEGALRLEVTAPEGPRLLRGSHLLVAAGRTPNTDDLGLAAAGIETDRGGFIRVDARLATSVDGVYALGDVNGGPAFTHISYDDFRILRENLLHGGEATTEGRLVPYTVFIDPQLGRVGMTEAEASRAGRSIAVASLPMTRVARAIEMDETRGFMKAIVDADTQQILGCAILGVEGGEVMSVLQAAMMGGLAYPAIRDAVFAHPTLSESLNNLFMSLDR
jgi:pyruvate/2-oxoglutarate dehydrogenase complex dihydrolipoamide dehydrogenase (E3) component